MTMRRTTLAVILAVRRCAARRSGRRRRRSTSTRATSLTNVFPAIDKGPTYSFGGSNTLQLQIERGAPADVFASASPTEAQALFREGLCTRPVTFAINRLVAADPERQPGQRDARSTRCAPAGASCRSGPPGVPIGAYTRQLLKRMRLSSILSSNTVSQQTNVGQVASQVALGAADAGFVYYTDGLAAKDRTKMLSLPKWAQPPVRYQICAVRARRAPTRAAPRPSSSRSRARPGAAALKALRLRAAAAQVGAARGVHRAAGALHGDHARVPRDPDRRALHRGAAPRRPGAAGRAGGAGRARGHPRARTSSPTR